MSDEDAKRALARTLYNSWQSEMLSMEDPWNSVLNDEGRSRMERVLGAPAYAMIQEAVSQARESEREKMDKLVQEHLDVSHGGRPRTFLSRHTWRALLEKRRRDDSADPSDGGM